MNIDQLMRLDRSSLTDYVNSQPEEWVRQYETATESISFQPDPRNEPQSQAFNLDVNIILYAGKPHGGKSFLHLLNSYHRHKNSLILRRSFSELESGLINDAKRFFPVSDQYYKSQRKAWELPHCSIRFGYGGTDVRSIQDNDLLQYKGPNWDYIGIDEASEMKRFEDGATIIDLLLPWNRTTMADQATRMVLTSNPGGVGEEWLMEWFAPWLNDRFHIRAVSSEVLWVTRNDDDVLVFSKEKREGWRSITWIWSSYEDNPYTPVDYESTLRLTKEPLRTQLLQGKFGLGSQDELYQIIPSAWVKLAQARWEEREVRPGEWTAGGIDAAMGGLDNTVLARRVHNWFDRNQKWAGKETPTGRQAAEKLWPHLRAQRYPILIDSFGVGAKAYGELRALGADWVRAIFGNEKTETREKNGQYGFANTRAEAVWRMMEALDPDDGANVMLPPDQMLLADLCAYRWAQCAQGVKVKEKKDMIKDLGRSPDDGDATIMCWYAGYRDVSKQIAEAFGNVQERMGKYAGAF